MSHNIDKIFYINLEKRKDRKEEIENELNNFNLPYERYNAIHHKDGNVGCGYSHINVLKLAKERNYKNILILEDDFTFLVSKERFEELLTNYFDTIKDFDVCLISYNLIRDEIVPNTDIVKKVLEAQTTSGYIINYHYYDKLINLFEKSMIFLEKTGAHWLFAIDQVWKLLQPNGNWYYFTTRIGKQRAGYSDNAGCYTDLGC